MNIRPHTGFNAILITMNREMTASVQKMLVFQQNCISKVNLIIDPTPMRPDVTL